DDVVCSSKFGNLVPMENAEMLIHLVEGRPSKNNLDGSPMLKQFIKATNVRLRLNRDTMPDTTVTRRYYYGIKELYLFGRCICNGHSAKCEAQDPSRPRARLCLCEHNTEGDQCERCKSGYVQKKWWASHDTDPFVCEPCNCHGHSGECVYEKELDMKNASLDIHGKFLGGGRCLNCQHNTQGINCNQCTPRFYRPAGKKWMDLDVCQHCPPCGCDVDGSTSSECDVKTAACACKSNFGGLRCEQCAKGYYKHPQCAFCNCDLYGTEDGVCTSANGQCLCKTGFAGRHCDRCDDQFYGYPNCLECGCHANGAKTMECDTRTGACPCIANFTGRTCDKCSAGHNRFPDCLACDCFSVGSKGISCDFDGQCYCRTHFEGKRCEKCKPNFFNWPVCEECNCHPSGVVPEFAACDKVLPGELCTCRSNVQGPACSQCKPNTWDLQAHHPKGCCDLCADGFYNIRADSHVGCEPCNCDVGGAIGITCHQETGQCHCRPRVGGRRCDKPIQNHFFPTLWHNRYEAENGRLPDGKNVFYTIDANEFRNFSLQGFVVFSTIQEEIVLDVNIRKSTAKLVPVHTQTSDSEQFTIAVLAPSGADPLSVFIETTPDQTFVLNPGRWNLHIRSPKRLYLDYVVLTPVRILPRVNFII
uniref:Laminin EGF-like domain-containing protein n=1 Tax=Globodera pallida TaxID=36090 RepID=A0A183CHS1_GLOPA